MHTAKPRPRTNMLTPAAVCVLLLSLVHRFMCGGVTLHVASNFVKSVLSNFVSLNFVSLFGIVAFALDLLKLLENRISELTS